MRSALSRHFKAIRFGRPPPQVGETFPLEDLQTRPRSETQARIRSLSDSVYLGDGTALCRVLGRYKMFVDTADLGLSPHLMLDGYWEMWLTEAIARTVRPGMTVVDVGANLGYFSLLMAGLVGPSGRVHAFEPNAPIVSRLRRSVTLNGFDDRIQVHDCALSSEEGGEALLVVPRGEPKNAYLAPLGQDMAGSDIRRTVTRRLDAFPELEGAAVIKIDADTAEEAIWRGMSGLLALARPMTIFLEFAAARYADPAAFLADIRRWSFSVARLELEGEVTPVSDADVLQAPPRIDQMLVLRR